MKPQSFYQALALRLGGLESLQRRLDRFRRRAISRQDAYEKRVQPSGLPWARLGVIEIEILQRARRVLLSRLGGLARFCRQRKSRLRRRGEAGRERYAGRCDDDEEDPKPREGDATGRRRPRPGIDRERHREPGHCVGQ